MSERSRQRYARSIARVLAHIEQHLDEALDLDTLSQVAHFSRFHFHRQFSAYTGITAGRLVHLLRLKRASLQLVFNPGLSITGIAHDAGFSNAESFSRAFRKVLGQSPSAFRKAPRWQDWQVSAIVRKPQEQTKMQVDLIDFPETLIAVLENHGPERLVYQSTARFIEWRRSVGLGPEQGSTYGIHYSDPVSTLPEDYRLDLALSVAAPVAANPQGVVNKVIPAGRCARVRHLGSRAHVAAADWLYREWLPQSGEQLRDFPIFFHYVNVGPGVQEHQMVTDVYLPLR